MSNAAKTTLFLFLAATLAVATGCMEQRDDRDYVQTNVVDKSLFEGEWYHSHTVIDNDQESAYAWAFRGSVSFDQTNSVIGTIARIRFVIDEDWLYAFRSYPVVADADRTPTGERDMDLYEPMAAWPIESHFDIVRRYNTTTGEVLNVVEENTQDRPWYERQYMRVDWAGNVMTDGYNFNDIDVFDPLGIVTREPASTFVQEGSEFPEQWQPQFDFTPVEEPARDSWEWEYWDRYGPDRLYHFAFVTQEIWQPGIYPFLYSWALPWQLYGSDLSTSASLVSVRHSFLRVPDEIQYEPQPLPESEWEQFGAWRIEQPTYIWGDLPDEENGLSDFYGRTDALNYWTGRHNIWRRSFTYDDEGRRVSIPMAEREVQPVIYTLSERFPAWLLYPAFDLIGEWNGAMMETVRIAQNTDGTPVEDILPVNYIEASEGCTSDAQCLEDYGDDYPWTNCRVTHNGGSSFCTRHYNPFLEPDPELRDYDCHIVALDEQGNEIPPTDPGYDLDAFDRDDLAIQRTFRFVGTECVLMLRNNTCDDPHALAAAIDERCGEGESECRERYEGNSDLLCDQMGDLRFNLLAFNDQVGVMWGGISQPLMDPITGELVQANANSAGLSVEGAMTYVNYYMDVADENDEIDELSYMIGEDVRQLMENSDYAIPPVTPAVPPFFSSNEIPLAGMEGMGMSSSMPDDARSAARRLPPRIQHSLDQAWNLRGVEGQQALYTDRMRNLAGTRFEQMLYGGADGIRSLGLQVEDEYATPNEEMLDMASIFRTNVLGSESELAALRERMSRRNFHPSADMDVNSFVDNTYINWLRSLPEDLSPQQRSIAVGRSYFRSVMLHEMGHSVGMRHNFAGSLDYANYHDQYYHIDEQFPLPVQEDYDTDDDGVYSYTELARFNSDLYDARQERELNGIARWYNASIMEYMPRISNDLQPLGRYDRGFIHRIYGDQIETYTEEPVELRIAGTTQNRGWMARPDRANRVFERYFSGGEGCRIDRNTNTGFPERFHHEDCPYGVLWVNPNDRGEPACETDSDCDRYAEGMRCMTDRGWCMSDQLPEGQLVGQRCAENPRADQAEHREDLPGVCVGYQDSWSQYLSEVGPANSERFPVEYRFCSDERTADISWCNRFDEGESFREMMNHYRERWVNSYPFRYFRRYRANWGGTSNFSTFADIAKIMAHFYYRYFYEEIYLVEGDVWVDSMTDHLAGAAAGMNFLAEIIAQPDVGSYDYDPDTDSYELVSSGELGEGDLDIPVGLGRYMWSSYQEGPFGIFRMERMGTYNDKLYALYALARREWNLSYNYDERFWINFYSMFPYEMSQLYGGLILDSPELYGPRVCEAGQDHPYIEGATCERDTLVYQDLWRGPQMFAGDVENYRGNPFDEVYGTMPSVGGGSSDLLRMWALIFSLAEFPVFYDTTYEQQMYVFVEGSGESFNVRDCEDYPDDELCVVEGVDYIRYHSDNYHVNFVAFTLEREFDWEPDQVNTSYAIVERAVILDENIAACEEGLPSCPVAAGPAREAALEEWRLDLEETESFIISVVDVQSLYDIAAWL